MPGAESMPRDQSFLEWRFDPTHRPGQWENVSMSDTPTHGRIEVKPGSSNNGPATPPGPPPLDRLFDRLPPHSIEAEMSLLGSLILDPEIASDVVPIVRDGTAFYRPAHGAVFEALIGLYDTHQSGDLVQLLDVLRSRDVLEQVGGAEYLDELAGSVPSPVNAAHYARIVADKARLRRLIDAAGQILYDAFHTGRLGPDGAREIIDTAEQRIFEIAQEEQATDPENLADLLQQEIDRLEALMDGKALMGVRTHFAELDDTLSGLQPGEMVIIAARPSMGKTALALNLAEQIALGGPPHQRDPAKGVPVGLFSLEMSKSAIVQRLISGISGVGTDQMRHGGFGKDVFQKLHLACAELTDAPICVDDTPGQTILAIRARARRMVARHAIKVIIIDYLQLLTAPGSARESRQVEVSAISRGVKALARELNIPVIALSQLNRGAEQREGNRPRMSDLRESGSLEQDADVVMLLHREAYYHLQDKTWREEHPDRANLAEVIIAKQRNGPTGIVRLTWDSKTTRFRPYAGASHDDEPWASDQFGAPANEQDLPPF